MQIMGTDEYPHHTRLGAGDNLSMSTANLRDWRSGPDWLILTDSRLSCDCDDLVSQTVPQYFSLSPLVNYCSSPPAIYHSL